MEIFKNFKAEKKNYIQIFNDSGVKFLVSIIENQ